MHCRLKFLSQLFHINLYHIDVAAEVLPPAIKKCFFGQHVARCFINSSSSLNSTLVSEISRAPRRTLQAGRVKAQVGEA